MKVSAFAEIKTKFLSMWGHRWPIFEGCRKVLCYLGWTTDRLGKKHIPPSWSASTFPCTCLFSLEVSFSNIGTS